MVTVGEGLDKAVQGAFTRPIPKSAGAQMRYLIRQHQRSTRRVAELLGISQRTVKRYVKNQIKKPRPELADRLEREVRARWQPQIRAKAKQTAASTGGIMIDVQARFGYTAAPGSTDDARVRHLTLALPPQHAARLFQAQEAGLTEDQLRQIAAEALGEVYFRDNGHRAHGLEVELTDLIDLEFELEPVKAPDKTGSRRSGIGDSCGSRGTADRAAGRGAERIADPPGRVRQGLPTAGVLRLWTCRRSPTQHDDGGLHADAKIALNATGGVLAELYAVQPAVPARALPAYTTSTTNPGTGTFQRASVAM